MRKLGVSKLVTRRFLSAPVCVRVDTCVFGRVSCRGRRLGGGGRGDV